MQRASSIYVMAHFVIVSQMLDKRPDYRPIRDKYIARAVRALHKMGDDKRALHIGTLWEETSLK